MYKTVAKSEIQKQILTKLIYHRTVRFRDLKPAKIGTNLFSYHIKQMMTSGLLEHEDDGYTLSTLGLAYIDRLNDDGVLAYPQTKMVTMFVIQNSNGDLLLERRNKQPYIDTWTLPNGKLSIDDESLVQVVRNEVRKRFKLRGQKTRHAGDCYIRVHQNDAPITVTFAHIFAFETDKITVGDDFMWARPHKLHTLNLAPAVDQIVARTFFRDPFFFEEFEHDW